MKYPITLTLELDDVEYLLQGLEEEIELQGEDKEDCIENSIREEIVNQIYG